MLKSNLDISWGLDGHSRYSHVFHEFVRATNVDELSEADLGNDSSELTRGSRNTVASRTVASGERFPGNNESSGIGAEVLEEVGEAVQEDENALS